jgi:outer membrane protein assembly factor BamB
LVEGPRADLDYEWNYVCRAGAHLLGSAAVPEAFYKGHWGGSFWYTDAGGSMAYQVTSDNLFSLNPDTGETEWEYTEGLILSVTISVGDGKVFFLETRNQEALDGTQRRLSATIWKKDLYLVCLDLDTGSKLWDKALTINGGTQTVFLMYDSASAKLVLSAGDGSKNHLYAFDPANGTQLWYQAYGIQKADHGGKNQHPVIMGGEIFITPNVLDIADGTVKRSNIPKSSGCNTYLGSKNLLFYRTGYSGEGLSMWPATGGASTGVDRVRGACWLSWAPADGMFLIQEKSAGCSCGQWVHVSSGWAPRE